MKRLLLLSLILLVVGCNKKDPRPKVIAYKGYWQTTGAVPNSVASLECAYKTAAYGTELDVQLTWDNILVVYGNSVINGINIQQSNYDRIKDIKLQNGEILPTLEDYLTKAKELEGMQLFFNLRPHSTSPRNKKAVQLSVEAIKTAGMENRTQFLSLNLDACKEFLYLMPGGKAYYVNGNLTPAELKEAELSGLYYNYKVMQRNPDWFQQAGDLGLKIGVWSVNDDDAIQEMMNYNVDFISTDNPEKVFEIMNKQDWKSRL